MILLALLSRGDVYIEHNMDFVYMLPSLKYSIEDYLLKEEWIIDETLDEEIFSIDEVIEKVNYLFKVAWDNFDDISMILLLIPEPVFSKFSIYLRYGLSVIKSIKYLKKDYKIVRFINKVYNDKIKDLYFKYKVRFFKEKEWVSESDKANISLNLEKIFKPNGKLPGRQVGKSPTIRTVSQSEAEKFINKLIESGAKKVKNSNYKNGTWYEFPNGRGFGIRNIPSNKSLRHGTNNTIDLIDLKIEGLEKIKY
jgi:hypothetical protein